MPLPSWINRFELKPNCWVYVPSKETIKEGRIIKSYLEKYWLPPFYYCHLNPGGHVKALKLHIKSNFFIRADISQFFNRINRSRVTREFKKFYPSYKIARENACKSIVPSPVDKGNFILPFGFVQSPIIASICLSNSRLGKFLTGLVSKGYAVSIYMDDIIISDNNFVIRSELNKSYDKLHEAANRSGFELNMHKTLSPENKITAFNVELSNNHLAITNDRYKRFLDEALMGSDTTKEGMANYISSISATQEASFRALL